jgi:hypothetical protein
VAAQRERSEAVGLRIGMLGEQEMETSRTHNARCRPLTPAHSLSLGVGRGRKKCAAVCEGVWKYESPNPLTPKAHEKGRHRCPPMVQAVMSFSRVQNAARRSINPSQRSYLIVF